MAVCAGDTVTHTEFRADFGEGEAGDVEDFLAGLFALEGGHGAAGEGEGVGEESEEFVVGAAFEGGGVDFDFKRVTEPADDRVARGVGDGFDGEGAGRQGHRFRRRENERGVNQNGARVCECESKLARLFFAKIPTNELLYE